MNYIDWMVVNKATGETLELDMFVTKDGGSFDKIYLKEFAKAIECTGDGSIKLLAYMLKNKNYKNEVLGTQKMIANESGVGSATVSRTFKALIKHGFLKMKYSGMYIINPSMIHYGQQGNKIAILKVWENI